MATSGGAAAAFKVPAATGHAVHIQDSPLILRYAQTPASARHRKAWLLANSALREQPAFGPLPRFQAELISLLPPLPAPCCFPSILVQAWPRGGLASAHEVYQTWACRLKEATRLRHESGRTSAL